MAIADNAATRYVRAAQRSDTFAPSISSPESVRLDSNHANALSEALYSTGRVMMEKSADTHINPTPIQHISWLPAEAVMIRPMIISHDAACEEKFTSGTSAERIFSGA